MEKVKWFEEMSVKDFIRLYPEFWFHACMDMPEELIKDLLTDPLYIVRVTIHPDNPDMNIAEIGYSNDNWNISA